MSPSLQATIQQGDFSAGMSRDVAPPLISPAGAFDLLNALLNEDGSVYRRGGSVYKSTTGLGTGGLTWIRDSYLKPGRRTIVANAAEFGALADDDLTIVALGGTGLSEPMQSAVLEDILFIGGGTLYGGSLKSAVYSTGTVTVTNGSRTVTGSGTTWNTLVDAGMLFQIGSGRVYVVESIDSTSQLTLRDAYQGGSGGGNTYELKPTHRVDVADPYEDGEFVCTCANRIVVGAGRKIKFTEVDNPHTFTHGLGTTNEHTLPEGVQIVGLTTMGQSVLIFTTGGIWVLEGLALSITDGAGNPQHRMQQLSSEVVLAGAAGLAGLGQQVVVPATEGIFLMDGISQPERISKPIDRLYRKRIADGYKFGGAAVCRNHYLLPILGSGSVRDLLVCRLDRPISDRSQRIFPWTRFDGDAGETKAFTVRNSLGARRPLLLGAQGREQSRIVDCTGFFEPSRENATDADGSVHQLDIVTRDFETGNGTVNVVRDFVLRYELAGQEEPVLKVSRAAGAVEAGYALWDHAAWDEFNWAAEESAASFVSLERDAPVSDEREIHICPVNKRQRYARFRIRSYGPAAYCALRSVALRIRPSQAVRR
jgi:hypothetical protein